jgi:hypothetical protein
MARTHSVTYLPKLESLEDRKRYNDAIRQSVNFGQLSSSRTGVVQEQKIWKISCSKNYKKLLTKGEL